MEEIKVTKTKETVAKSNGTNESTDAKLLQDSATDKPKPNLSIIEQRVISLFGIEALQKGIYAPKCTRFYNIKNNNHNRVSETAPLSQSIQQTSSTNGAVKNNNECEKNGPTLLKVPNDDDEANSKRESVEVIDGLPCSTHLTQEFRTQLPAVLVEEQIPEKTAHKQNEEGAQMPPETHFGQNQVDVNGFSKNYYDHSQELDRTYSIISAINSELKPRTSGLKLLRFKPDRDNIERKTVAGIAIKEVVDDIYYFLHIVDMEQNRLLKLIESAEADLTMLMSNGINNGDALELIRSTLEKTRYLISHVMGQFKDLCYKNLNNRPCDIYSTDVDDLRAFLGMVYLKIDSINELFKEIDELKANNWVVVKTEQAPISRQRRHSRARRASSNNRSSNANPVYGRKNTPLAEKTTTKPNN